MKIEVLCVAVLFFLLSQKGISQTAEERLPADTFFYNPVIHSFTHTVEKPQNISEHTDQLQDAIDLVESNGGGTLYINASDDNTTYTLKGVNLKSNVHIKVAPEVVFKPMGQMAAIFNVGRTADVTSAITNFSIQCSTLGKQYTFNLNNIGFNERIRVFSVAAAANFRIADFFVADNQTKFAAMNFVPFQFMLNGLDVHLYPEGGIVENLSTENTHYGYGVVQVQASKRILFRNLNGEGGVSLRLETDVIAEANKSDRSIRLDKIFGRNIVCTGGQAALTLSPHTVNNGIVDVDDITAINCEVGAIINKGFLSKKLNQVDDNGNALNGYQNGYFDEGSIVSNIKVSYGTSAQFRAQRLAFVPCNQRHYIDETGEIPIGPSLTGIFYFATGGTDRTLGYYTVKTSNLELIGFPQENKAILRSNEEKINCPDTFIKNNGKPGYKIYPNPGKVRITIETTSPCDIEIYNLMGNMVKYAKMESCLTSIRVSDLKEGIYFARVYRDSKPMDCLRFYVL